MLWPASATSRPETAAAALPCDVSIVVPFLDERESLPPLIAELRAVLERLDRPAEVVLVDDGSADGSAFAAQQAIGEDHRFRLVRLRQNFGKSAALAAGRDASRGEIIVTMDADLQDDPSRIPLFLAAIDAGADVVAGWRTGREAPRHRQWASRAFNWLTAKVTRIGVHDMNCGFKAYRREVLESIHLSAGMHRYLAVIAHGRGFRLAEVAAPHRERLFGKTKFGAGRYLETALGFAVAMLLRRRARPGAFGFGGLGLVLLALATLGLIAVALGWLPPSMPAVLAVWTSAVFGVQFVLLRLAVEVLLQHAVASGAAVVPYVVDEVHGPAPPEAARPRGVKAQAGS